MLSKIIKGIIIILIGLWIWLSNLGYLSFSFSRDWPVLIVIIGILILIDGIARYIRRHR